MFAEPIDKDVLAQITAREKLMATGRSVLGLRNPSIIQAQNSTSWIRLASSVNVVDGAGIVDATLAKKTILSGGTQEELGVLKEGLQGSYELDSNMGYRPMAGIQGVKFEYYNNGALAKADIDLVCYTPDQFNRIEKLFLRPGYSVLLEWGHTSYTTNGTDVNFYDKATSPALNLFLEGNVDSSDIAREITKERLSTKYNYEAFHGIVVNFNWTFNSDNSYSIVVKTITQGSIIESLKINNASALGKAIIDDQAAKEKKRAEEKLDIENKGGRGFIGSLFDGAVDIAASISSGIDSFFAGALEVGANLLGDLGWDGKDDNNWQENLKEKANISQIHQLLYNIVLEFTPIDSDDDRIGGGLIEVNTKEVIRVGFDVDSDDDQDFGNLQYYMTLGRFLTLFKTNFLVKTKNNKLYIDIQTDYETTAMVTFPGQFSADPLVCIIPIAGFVDKDLIPKFTFELFKNLPNLTKFNTIKGVSEKYLLDLMQVWVNFNYIMKVVDDVVDNKGSAVMIEFIQKLLSGINEALGGVGKFGTRVIENAEINPKTELLDTSKTLAIYDEGAHIKTSTVEPIQLNPYGVSTTSGTTFTALSFQSELSKEFASMISIGAQAHGNQVGTNATAFSVFNKGLIDRITPEKIVGNNITVEENKEISPLQEFKNSLVTIQTSLTKIYKNFVIDKNNIETLTSANSTYAPFLLGYLTEMTAIAAPFFIPFNLSFTLKGISGIRIFDKFYLGTGILPESYRDKVAFLVKNVQHEVKDNNWTTSIETLTVPVIKTSKTMPAPTLEEIKGERIPKPVPVTNPSVSAGNPGEAGKPGYTLRLGIPINSIYYDGPTEKSIIVIHHTAGHGPGVHQTVATFNQRDDKVATHFVIGRDGTVDQLFPYTAWAYHLGLGNRKEQIDQRSIGIEMVNIGPLEWVTAPNTNQSYLLNYVDAPAVKKGSMTYAKARKYTLGVNAVKSVDANGKEAPYKTFSYWENYPPVQIAALKKVITEILANNPKCKLTYSFDQFFPPPNTVSKVAMLGASGVFTHNSYRADKVDVGPVPEIINLMSTAFAGSTAPKNSYPYITALIKILKDGGEFEKGLLDKIAGDLAKKDGGEIEAMQTARRSMLDEVLANNSTKIDPKTQFVTFVHPLLEPLEEELGRTPGVPPGGVQYKVKPLVGWGGNVLAYAAWKFGSRKSYYGREGKKAYESPRSGDSDIENAWEAQLNAWIQAVPTAKAFGIDTDL